MTEFRIVEEPTEVMERRAIVQPEQVTLETGRSELRMNGTSVYPHVAGCYRF